MGREVRRADARVEGRRSGAAREWRELKRAIRAETGLSMESVVWAAALGGLTMGFELARRWFHRPRPQPRQ